MFRKRFAINSSFVLTATALAVSQAYAQSSLADNAHTGAIQEVVVTAQKVAQPVSRTPVAITAVQGEDLAAAGIVDATGLGQIAPNVQVAEASGRLQIAIRGVTSLDQTPKGDSSTAFHVDGVYISRQEAQFASFFDVDRVEVLRGPQGTLYGRNATAGAINVITARPGSKFGGKAGIELGNYDTVRADAAVNIPVNDLLWLRVAAIKNKRGTYLNPGPNTDVRLSDRDDSAGRLHALLRFRPGTQLLLTAESARSEGAGTSPVPLTNFFKGTIINAGNAIKDPVYVDYGATTQLTAKGRFATVDSRNDVTTDAVRAELQHELPFANLTYQTGWLHQDVDNLSPGNFRSSPFYNTAVGENSQVTHELRLNSLDGSALRWVGGVYAFNEQIVRDMRFYTLAPTGTVTIINKPYITNKSRAAFGQATYSVAPGLRVTAGLRYTDDKKHGDDPIGGAPPKPYNKDKHFTNTSWKLGFEQDVGRSVMLYENVSTGYKAGGYNDSNSPLDYRPEKLLSFEVGAKGRFLENRLQVSAALFHYRYTDLQLTANVCVGSNCNSQTSNASNASINGLEVEGKYNLTASDHLNFSVSSGHGRLGAYKPNATADWSGQQLDRAPDNTAMLGYTHDFDLANGGTVSGYVGTRYSSSYYLSDPGAGSRYQQPSFHKSEARLTYTSPTGTFSLQGYVRNIENAITIEARLPAGFTLGDPRTAGVRANWTF